MVNRTLQESRLAAVIVTFNPDERVVFDNISLLARLGIEVIVFDNTPLGAPGMRSLSRHGGAARYMGGSGNIGLSAAYNEAVSYARLERFDAVLFLDQDSLLEETSILRLRDSFRRLSKKLRLGVLGGKPLRRDGSEYRTARPMPSSDLGKEYQRCRMVTSSFSIVPLDVFASIGLFYDDFFIDHIDMDFCARCLRNGFEVIMDTSATFRHRVGQGDITFLGQYLFPISAPFRHYFQIRNIILSGRRRGVSRTKVALEVFRRFAVISASCLYAGEFAARSKYALRGVIDGIRGRGGPLSAYDRSRGVRHGSP